MHAQKLHHPTQTPSVSSTVDGGWRRMRGALWLALGGLVANLAWQAWHAWPRLTEPAEALLSTALLPVAASAALLLVLALFVVAPALRAGQRQALRLQQHLQGRERLAQVAELTHNVVVITDGERRLQWANAAFTRLSGYELHEVQGRPLTDFVLGELCEAAAAASLQTALDAGTAARVQLRVRSRAGRDDGLDLDLQPQRSAAGELVGFVAVATVNPTPVKQGQAGPVVAAPPADAQNTQPLESELRQALTEDQLALVYQPVLGLSDGRLMAAEAQLRWRHPERGELQADSFIGVAESCGLADAIADRVLQQACAQFAQWQRHWGERAPPRLALKLARPQLQQPGLVPELLAVLEAHGMQPEQLQVQLSADGAAPDMQLQATLRALKAAGLRLALVDFGSGHSSLASLQQLPLHAVRLARSFVANADTVEHHRVLIQATTRMAGTLGLCTVADGVDTQAQADLMTALQCDCGQGAWFGPAMTAAELDRWIERESTSTEA